MKGREAELGPFSRPYWLLVAETLYRQRQLFA